MNHPRQTLSFLRRRLEEAGLRPATGLGQHFLIDLNLVEFLAASAEITPGDVVLEIGTGTGSLTALLAQRAAWVVSVEIDKRIHQLAREHLVGHSNVTLLLQDALESKHRIAANILEEVTARMAGFPGSRFLLVANLPYNIATLIITNFLLTPIVPHSMTVTIQKEVADRLVAEPSTKDYGALSVWVQSQCQVRVLRELPPNVFWPRPKVSSAIVRIVPSESLMQAIPDRPYFHWFTRRLFLHRRKLLRGTLMHIFPDLLSREQWMDMLAGLGWPSDVRAEQLTWQDVLRLCESVRALGAESTSPEL
jgi:16S rRNA (adenine1518-N6/adenine1519-N6)-dimethyltransferase